MDNYDVINEIEERLSVTPDPFKKRDYELFIKMIKEAGTTFLMLKVSEGEDKIEFAGDIISNTGYDQDIPKNHISYRESIQFFNLMNELVPDIIPTDETTLRKAYQKGIDRDIGDDMFVSLESYGNNIISNLNSRNEHFYQISIRDLQETLKYSYNYNKAPAIKIKEAFYFLTECYPEKFKIEGNKYFILNPNFSKSGSEMFKIIAKMPFYQDNPDFDPNHKFIKFLNESKAVPLDPDMLLVPFKVKIKDDNKFKTTYFYFTVNSRSETINLRFTDTGFEYANQQSNFFYQLRSALTPEQRNDYQNFESYILKELQTATGHNSKLLKDMYNDFKKFINNKYVDLTQIDV